MLNKIILQGRLTADPELRHTPSNTPVASFSVAVERSYTGKDGERPTDFHDVVAWRGCATFAARYFKKGMMILVEGALENETWTDKETGKQRRKSVVRAENLFFGEPKRADAAQGSDSQLSELSDDDPEQLPF